MLQKSLDQTSPWHLVELAIRSGTFGEIIMQKLLMAFFWGSAITYQTRYHNLDVIIAVGYRVNSFQATQFRIWATQTLREFIIKGFVMDDERLKQGKRVFGKDYFDELLERIREIRASERCFYQKITDIYALSLDYSADSPLTKEFFATVQNKLHWAITGQTARN
jgi:hypothetical protein